MSSFKKSKKGEGVNFMAIDDNQTYGGNHFIMYTNIKLQCTPETNIMLYTNFTLIKKRVMGEIQAANPSRDSYEQYP